MDSHVSKWLEAENVPRFERLPRWAKDHIGSLSMRLQESYDRLENAQPPDGLIGVGSPPHGSLLRDRPPIRISHTQPLYFARPNPGNDSYWWDLEARWYPPQPGTTQPPTLQVRSVDGPLVIRPHTSNVANLSFLRPGDKVEG